MNRDVLWDDKMGVMTEGKITRSSSQILDEIGDHTTGDSKMNIINQITSREVRRHLQPRGKNKILHLNIMAGGRRIRESMHTPNLRDATQRAVALLSKFHEFAPSDMRLSKLLEEYLKWAYTENTVFHTNGVKRTFLHFKEFVGDKKIGDITPKNVEDYVTSLASSVLDTVDGKPVKRSAHTLNNRLMAISAVFTYAVDKEWLERNPAAKVKRRKVLKRKANAYEPETMLKIINAARGRREDFEKIIEIYLFTGLRLGEGVQLQAKDVDFPKRMLTLSAEKTKTGVERTIPLNSRCLTLLKELIGKYGKPIPFPRRSIEEFFKDVREIVGFSGKFHDLRKSTNSWLKSYVGLGDSYCEMILGHAGHENVNTKHYTAAMPGVLEEAMEKLVKVLYPDGVPGPTGTIPTQGVPSGEQAPVDESVEEVALEGLVDA